MSNPEYLRIPGGVTAPEDDRRELRRVAKMDAGANEPTPWLTRYTISTWVKA